jgi:hypothetical protein
MEKEKTEMKKYCLLAENNDADQTNVLGNGEQLGTQASPSPKHMLDCT